MKAPLYSLPHRPFSVAPIRRVEKTDEALHTECFHQDKQRLARTCKNVVIGCATVVMRAIRVGSASRSTVRIPSQTSARPSANAQHTNMRCREDAGPARIFDYLVVRGNRAWCSRGPRRPRLKLGTSRV